MLGEPGQQKADRIMTISHALAQIHYKIETLDISEKEYYGKKKDLHIETPR